MTCRSNLLILIRTPILSGNKKSWQHTHATNRLFYRDEVVVCNQKRGAWSESYFMDYVPPLQTNFPGGSKTCCKWLTRNFFRTFVSTSAWKEAEFHQNFLSAVKARRKMNHQTKIEWWSNRSIVPKVNSVRVLFMWIFTRQVDCLFVIISFLGPFLWLKTTYNSENN